MDDTQTARAEIMAQWLTQVFDGAAFSTAALAGDASFRRYHRLSVQTPTGEQRYIVMDAPPDKESVSQFVAVDELMTGAVHVPKLIAVNEAQGFIVLEDFGGTDFADVIHSEGGTADAPTAQRYREAMQVICQLQQIAVAQARAIVPDYDDALLRREMLLFSEWFLPYVGVAFDDTHFSPAQWQAVQDAIIAQVSAQPQVVVHRDFHSRNLMILPQDLGVIDFQDAVVGAYSYDIVSLLRDAYVDWSAAQTDAWLDEFFALVQPQLPHLTKSQFDLDTMMMGLQRHLKILGIFVRLYQRDGKARYLANLPRVLQDTLIETRWLASSQGGVFAKFDHWLNTAVVPAFRQTFSQSQPQTTLNNHKP